MHSNTTATTLGAWSTMFQFNTFPTLFVGLPHNPCFDIFALQILILSISCNKFRGKLILEYGQRLGDQEKQGIIDVDNEIISFRGKKGITREPDKVHAFTVFAAMCFIFNFQ